jgi:hypothetical protein
MRRTEVRSTRRRFAPRATSSTTAPRPGSALLHQLGALRFIPQEKMEAEGYGDYLRLLDRPDHTPSAEDSANSCAVPAPGSGQPGCTPTLETAILAGGCFWGMEELLRAIPGVLETEVGYAGGRTANPDLRAGQDRPHRPRRVGEGGVRPGGALLRPAARDMVLPHARPDDRQPPGQRRRDAVPVGRLRDLARAAPHRRGGEGPRRRLRQVAPPRCSPRSSTPAPSPGRGLPPGLPPEEPGRYSCHFLRD